MAAKVQYMYQMYILPHLAQFQQMIKTQTREDKKQGMLLQEACHFS